MEINSSININFEKGESIFRKPKYSAQDGRTQIGARVDTQMYKDFKRLCIERDSTVRDAVESLMFSTVELAKKQGLL